MRGQFERHVLNFQQNLVTRNDAFDSLN